MRIFKIICCSLLFLTVFNSALATPKPQFSKVYFFGDSLTDNGNNRDGLLDQAPVTNKAKNSQSQYSDGPVWAQTFVELMKQDGMLSPAATVKVWAIGDIKNFSQDVKAGDSVDFAYSGDPSGGVDFLDGKTYHPSVLGKQTLNFRCLHRLVFITKPTENDLCGMYNRITNSAINHDLDKDALYVIWIGANNIQQSPLVAGILTVDYLSHKVDPNDPAIIGAAGVLGGEIASNISASIKMLIEKKGAHNFLVVNLPNIGYTPLATTFDSIYAGKNQGQHGIVIQLLNNITTQLNANMAAAVQNIAKAYPGVTIYQPNINDMFDAMRRGDIVAFPKSSAPVNVDPVLAWDQTCCANQFMPNYTPEKCKPATGKEGVCNHDHPGSIALPNNNGYYTFFNYVHPSTCAHHYLARFLETYIGNISFEPYEKINLCTND